MKVMDLHILHTETSYSLQQVQTIQEQQVEHSNQFNVVILSMALIDILSSEDMQQVQ